MRINGKTKIIGVMGWPIEHSLSPRMHNAAFAAAGLDYVYLPLPVQPDQSAAAITGLKALGFVGANVTIPHKVAVMQYLDDIDRSAQMVGAVNTIVIQQGRAIGYNTDAAGFIRSLQNRQITFAGGKAVILGAGGAARALVCGLIDHAVDTVIIGARDRVKAAGLAHLFRDYCNIYAYDWQQEAFNREMENCDLLIHCTPLGMFPNIAAEPPVNWPHVNPSAAVCDIIYNPSRTRFLEQAAARGHVVINGQGMLVEQGAAAFELWTGQPAPREIMYSVFT
ncbi:MAG: shikimate dehydrogenase [Veillonellales bacterium]